GSSRGTRPRLADAHQRPEAAAHRRRRRPDRGDRHGARARSRGRRGDRLGGGPSHPGRRCPPGRLGRGASRGRRQAVRL
ncbi:MAG: hypothetical protein AVDCRST_MAG69-122, partial [uncultured Solirubrobacteraceae bacterium]